MRTCFQPNSRNLLTFSEVSSTVLPSAWQYVAIAKRLLPPRSSYSGIPARFALMSHKCLVQAAQGAVQDGAVPPVGADVGGLPHVLDEGGVASDGERRQELIRRG